MTSSYGLDLEAACNLVHNIMLHDLRYYCVVRSTMVLDDLRVKHYCTVRSVTVICNCVKYEQKQKEKTSTRSEDRLAAIKLTTLLIITSD